MTRSDVTTIAPSLLVIADLGDHPGPGQVSDFLHALGYLWAFEEKAVSADNMPDSAQHRREIPSFVNQPVNPNFANAVVVRLHLESPLEVVLGVIAEDLKPAGYLIGLLIGVERGIRLVMDWQKHRAELRGMRAAADVADATQEELAKLTDTLMSVHPKLSEEFPINAVLMRQGLHDNVTTLLSKVELIEVRRLDD